MERSTDLLFVNSSPSVDSTREKALQRSEALSHAARVSHARKRQAYGAVTDKPITVQVVPRTVYISNHKRGERRHPSTIEEDDTIIEEDHFHAAQDVNHRKESQHVHNWLSIQRTARALTHRAKATKRPCEEITDILEGIPGPHKGNSDPFASTPVPMTSLDLALIKDGRASLIDIIWPAEISIRKNLSSRMWGMWNLVPGILDGPETVHAILSDSYYFRARSHPVGNVLHQNAWALAEKHEMSAIKGLRGLVDEFHRSQDRELLKQIRDASGQLASCGVISGDGASAQVHFAGVKMAVDIMGGLKKLPPMQHDVLIFSQVANAWFSYSRPVFQPSEWDPGSWSEYARTMPLHVVSTFRRSSHSSSSYYDNADPPPSMVSFRLRAIFNEFSEMVYVQEMTLTAAASSDEIAPQVFRWSNLRKLAIYARLVCLWCDFRDFVANSLSRPVEDHRVSTGTIAAAAFNNMLCLAVRTFARAIFEEHYYHDRPAVFRLSSLFLAEVAAILQRLDPPFAGHADPLKYPGEERRRVLADERRFDMLWVYSVGTYIEDCHARPEQRDSPTLETVTTTFGNGERKVGLFGQQFQRLAKVLGFEHVEEVTTLLSERYLYCARLQDDSLRRSMSVRR